MAINTNLTLRGGTDHRFDFTILDANQTAAVDITGWTLSWIMKSDMTLPDNDAAVVKRTDVGGITITGTYNADPNVNTQRAAVAIDDVDTDALAPRPYSYELKRMDDGLEAVLAFGNLVLVQSVHRQ